MLLKVVLFAYSRGITSSRRIARACEENVVFMALSADSRPHFATIAEFLSSMSDQIESVFTDVLTVCYTEGLIGKTIRTLSAKAKKVREFLETNEDRIGTQGKPGRHRSPRSG